MADITPIVTQMATVARTITGLSSGQVFEWTPSNPPDTYPWVYFTILGGQTEQPPLDVRITTHEVNINCVFSLQSGSEDAEANARPYVKKVFDKFDLNQTLNGTTNVMTTNVVSYKYGVLKPRAQDPQEYLGLQFLVHILEVETGNLYAS